MDYSLGYPTYSSLESLEVVHDSSKESQLNFKAHWSNNMYSSDHFNSVDNHQLITDKIDISGKNSSFSRMHSTQCMQSLSVDNMVNQPKKETLWQSMFRSTTNLLGEHLTRGTGSLIKNWANMNNPLSVTVVSQDFYKSLQKGKDNSLIDSLPDCYVTKSWSKESFSSDDILPNILYDNKILGDSVKQNDTESSNSDKMWKEYKQMYVDFNETQEKNKDFEDKKIVNSVNNSDSEDKDVELHFNIITHDEKDLNHCADFGKALKVNGESVALDNPGTVLKKQQMQVKAQDSVSQTTIVGTMLTNACKVMNGMVDFLQFRSNPMEDDPSLFTKRGSSPKPRPKKQYNVSSGRGRGRAKSQLRRSGVSQTRHRKERSKYDQSEDIKSDIENWEELEYGDSNEFDQVEDMDQCDFSGGTVNQESELLTMSFDFSDIKPRKRKQKNGKNCSWKQLNVNSFSVQNLAEDGDIENCDNEISFRSRLLSESSVDSEDSYCIIFEGEDCSKESDYETEDDFEETESESKTDDEDDNISSVANLKSSDISDQSLQTKKVRFNLIPIVHHMIQWSFACRAARPGPWQQMGRDRERFHERINCIGRVLEPVLDKQHRIRVWNERYEK